MSTLTMLLLALAACKRPTSGAADGGPDAAPSSSASASGSSEVVAAPVDPVPGQYGRYYVDMHRFSAAFPVSPELKRVRISLAVEARTEDGSAWVIICKPASEVRNEMEGAREQVVADGKLIAESHPSFYGGDAYEVSAKLPDHSERFMRFVRYAGRFCSVGAEIVNANREADATRFLASFRPEPPPPGGP